MDNGVYTKTNRRNFTVKRIIYYVLGVIEALLAIRFVFRLLGANPSSSFVSFIYTISQGLLVPFNAIFRSSVTNGIETKAVLEPSTMIAMVVYALIAWGFVKLIIIMRARN